MNKIAGYKAWTEFVEANSSKTIYALFSGGKDAATGKSWCPDCVTAEPVSFPYNNSQSCKKGPKLDCEPLPKIELYCLRNCENRSLPNC